MSNTLLLIFLGVATAYFGGKVIQIVPTLFKFLTALFTGVVKWPGPRIHDPDHSASVVRERLGVGYQNLFPTFISNALGVTGGFVFSLLAFLSSTSLLSGYVRINWTWWAVLLTLFALVGGIISSKKVQQNIVQVNSILSDLANKVEPRSVDGQTAEAEYAIEHPLIGYRYLSSDRKRALDLFFESTRCHQDGNEQRALVLYQEAMRIDPSLHENACAALSDMAQDCSSSDKGAVYYWLGLHSEYLMDWKQSAAYYEKAINAFAQVRYPKRESRAHCNLGNVKMHMRDPSAMEEFEKAIALNPKNGTAHLNIGTTYYSISERGDPRFERAMEAFADAIVADPSMYGPIVTSRLRSIGYTWKEDWEDVTLRVASKQLGINLENDVPAKKPAGMKTGQEKTGFETDVPVEKLDRFKTYRDGKHGFEIDVPEDWTVYTEIVPAIAPIFLRLEHGWTPKADVTFTCGPNEVLNIVVETMTPEPTPHFTESFFKLYAQSMNFINCQYGRIIIGNREHTWSRYQVDNEIWSKKYMIVLKGKGYAITASCKGKEMFLQREEIWDVIAASFRLTPT